MVAYSPPFSFSFTFSFPVNTRVSCVWVCVWTGNGSRPPLALLTVPSQEKGKEWLAAHSANCTARSFYLSGGRALGAPPRKLVISCLAERGRAGWGRQITTCRRSLRKKKRRWRRRRWRWRGEGWGWSLEALLPTLRLRLGSFRPPWRLNYCHPPSLFFVGIFLFTFVLLASLCKRPRHNPLALQPLALSMYWCFAAVRWRRPLKATKTLNKNKHICKYFWKEIFKALKQSQEYSKALKYG